MTHRIFVTCDIGSDALDRFRERGWEVEVHDQVQPPPKALVLEKVRSGIAALVTTLRDPMDEEVFAAGAASGLRVVSQIAVGVDNIDRAAANRHRIPYTHTPDVLTDATAEYAFFMMGAVARRLYPAEAQVRAREWTTWHPYLPWLGDEVAFHQMKQDQSYALKSTRSFYLQGSRLMSKAQMLGHALSDGSALGGTILIDSSNRVATLPSTLARTKVPWQAPGSAFPPTGSVVFRRDRARNS